MQIEYHSHYSGALGRDMGFKVYGHSGRPVIFVPCQGGRFWDFEAFGMINIFAQWIEQGLCTVYSVDCIDGETYASDSWDKHSRIQQHERWVQYVSDEFIPTVNHLDWLRNGYVRGPVIFGCSMGAMHAGNLFFRRPHLFDGVLALSGLYGPEMFFGDYMDDLVYQNSPNIFLRNMPADHPYINVYNQKKMVFCVGQGAWEDGLKESTGQLSAVLNEKGIHATVDFWGYDVAHDWDWWYKQVQYYFPRFL